MGLSWQQGPLSGASVGQAPAAWSVVAAVLWGNLHA